MKSSRLNKKVIEFLDHSNRIESEYSKQALDDAKKAWGYLKDVKIITVADIVEVQRLLLHRIEPDKVGLRTFPVRIGWEIKPFKSIEVFERTLTNLCDAMNISSSGQEKADELYATKMHIHFEDIHPFPDGNGRTGRLIMNWHRIQLGLPLWIIHEGDEQYEYYKIFDKTKPW